MKSRLKSLCIVAILLGMSLSKFIGSYFGLNGKIMIVIASIIMSLIIIIMLICFKEYSAALVSFFMVFPLIVGVLGMYLNNIYLVLGALVLLIVFVKIIAKILPRFMKNKK